MLPMFSCTSERVIKPCDLFIADHEDRNAEPYRSRLMYSYHTFLFTDVEYFDTHRAYHDSEKQMKTISPRAA
ncbi:MAG: hypothetical protein Q7T80_12230, partial [Methanoregula sp.]|nr:hypothetical protein [Methanoregula sp.]